MRKKNSENGVKRAGYIHVAIIFSAVVSGNKFYVSAVRDAMNTLSTVDVLLYDSVFFYFFFLMVDLSLVLVLWKESNFPRRDLHNYILRFYIHTPFWGLLLKYNVIRKL